MARRFYTAEQVYALLCSDSEESVQSGSDEDFEGFSGSASDGSEMSSQSGPSSKTTRTSTREANSATGETAPNQGTMASTSEVPSTSELADANVQNALPFDVAFPRWEAPDSATPFIPDFTANPGINVEVEGFGPVNFFNLFVTDRLLEHIVLQTNLYASQFITKNPQSYYARSNSWRPTNCAEMRTFLGLTFAMGLVKKPSIRSYWSNSPVYATPMFPAVIPRSRYEILMRFWHFNDNSQCLPRNAPEHDRLYKLRPIIEEFTETFLRIYTPTQNISIDESLVKFKGRLHLKQFIPSKRARFGIKLYKMCESSPGYTSAFRIYEGKDSQLNPQGCPTYLGTSGKIVWELISPFLQKGYNLYVDNYYSSIPLFKSLVECNIGACGTIRKNRQGFPQSLVNEKFQKGQSRAVRSGKLLALKYRDKKDIYILSSIHTDATTAVEELRSTTPKLKPVSIIEYSKYMGGVDLADQVLQPYQVSRKSYTWYKKLVIHLFQVATYNSFVLYKKAGHSETFIDYQEKVIENLLFANFGPTYPLESENVKRLTERHFIALIPPSATKRNPQRRCRVCTKRGVRHDTRYYCPQCPSLPALCLTECFKIFHTEARF
ncbi:piggyBac transposable element-derived protein 4-like [Anomaloglossus baeobatrachus]